MYWTLELATIRGRSVAGNQEGIDRFCPSFRSSNGSDREFE